MWHSLFHAIAAMVDRYGYLAVFLGIFLEDFGVPSPGETMLIAAALSAAAGKLHFPVVLLLGILAAITGDSLGFAIGSWGGKPFVRRFGKYVFLTNERLEKVQSLFRRHGGKIVLVARFIEGLRQFNGIVSGLSGMQYRKFLLFNSIGSVLWVCAWGSAAYLLGQRIHQIHGLVLVILGALAVIGVLVLYFRHREGRM